MQIHFDIGFRYREPGAGRVWLVTNNTAALYTVWGYAEGAWEDGEHYLLHEPFDANFCESWCGGSLICRGSLRSLRAPLPVAQHTLTAVPRRPWMDIHPDYLREAKCHLPVSSVELPIEGFLRDFGGLGW